MKAADKVSVTSNNPKKFTIKRVDNTIITNTIFIKFNIWR